MNKKWLDRWDERYATDEFAYGVTPNIYLKEELQKLKVGTILFPAEGEGRNAIFAAKMGFNVTAFDISKEGKNKALKLANDSKVQIEYHVGELQTLGFKDEQFDAIALIFAHFPADIKSSIHKLLDKYLKKGGTLIFEAFSKSHLEYVLKNEKVGGPKDIESLFSIDEIKSDFSNYKVLNLEEKEIELNEGVFHNGLGSVIRFVGEKL